MSKFYTPTMYIVLFMLFILPLAIHAQPVKDSILKNYTLQDYENFLLKERRGEIPDQSGPVPMSPSPFSLVNNNAGSTGTGYFTQSETSILVFGDNIVIGYNDAGSNIGGANKFTGFSYSTDGGTTFTDGGSLPTNPGGDAGDPVLARDDVSGRIYYSTLQFVDDGIPIYRSDDDGQTWQLPTQGAPGMSGFADKQWIAVDNYAGSGQGNVYMVVRDFGPRNGIYFYSSTDQGNTFGPNGGIEITSGFQGAFVAVGTDHSVYAFWWDGDEIKMRKSTDFGVSFAPAVVVASGLTGPQTNGGLGLTGTRNGLGFASGFRSNSFPHAAVNPVSGHIYVTYNDNPDGTDKGDIYMVMSTDGGTSWSSEVLVNDDGTTTDQWQPTIAVTPDGTRLGIFYNSRQDDIDNNLFRFYGRTAGISGSTLIWNPSLAISDVNSLPEFGRDSRVNSSYMGDYNQATATNSHFHIVWSDNRDDLAGGDSRKDPNVYYKSIPVDPFAGPNISVTPVNIDFGKVPVDAGAVSVEVSVYNPGDEQLIISGWSLNNPAFSTTLSVPEFIPPDGSFTLNVSFNPNALGTFDGIFTVASNALNSPNVQIPLTGVGTVDNDICAYATPIPEIGCDPVTVSGTTIDATVDSDAGNCGTSITAPGIWYTFLGTGTLMTASTCNAADFDTKISVYTGDCESLQCVVGSDDTPGCNAATTEVSWNSAVGEVYYILVHGFSDATGNFDLTISTDGLQPEIDVNPQQFEFVLEVDGTDSDVLTIGNFGDCPVDLSWFISENNPTVPDAPGYGNQTARPYPSALPLIYSIGEKSIHALEKDGFFDEVPVQEQLQSLTGQQFRTEEALMEALTSVVNVSEVDEDILSYMQKYMVVQSGRVLLSDEEAKVQASDIADPDQGSIYTPIELDKNFQPSNPLAAQVLFDNGPLVNSPGTGFGGADESVVQNLSLGLTFFGLGHQFAANNKVLEDFTVAASSGWIVETFDFFAYQTGSTTASTITGVYYQIYDGFPDDPGSNVVFGDFTTNRLLSSEWSNIYRVLETSSGNAERPIMKNTADAGFLLSPGDYWIAWQVDGTLASGPWVPAVTINGQAVTGNAYQSINDAAYNPVIDNGNVQGLPFVINGEINNLCTWLTPDQFSGITPGQTLSDVSLGVDATGLTPGTYTCDLIISSNASIAPEILVPVTLEVVGCFAPENLTATSITANSAELGWTETGSATSWQVRVGVEGFDTTGVVPENTNSNPTNVSDLSSLTNYEFYVRSECPDGSYSDWTGPFTFTTLCAPPVAQCKDYVFEFGTSSGQVVLNLTPADIDNGSFAECGLSSLAVSPNVLTFDCDNYNIPQEVTLTVIDVNGNSNSCTAQVYGTDETPPQAICQDLNVYLDQNGEFSISEDAVDGGSSDACGIASWDTDITAFSCDDLGEPVEVTLTVTDFAGNSSECQAEVTVLDTVSPVVMFCPPDYLLPSDPGECGAVADYFPIASDNCGIASFITSPAPGTFLPVGTTTVTSTAVDLSGNTTICTFDVTVFDSEVPTIITPGNIVVNNDPGQCGAVIDYDLTITDNCGIASTFVSIPSGSFFPVGIHTVNIFVTDVNGQFRTASFEVTVYDREAPEIDCPGDIVVNTEPGTCEAIVEFLVSASDNCPGAIQIITDIPSGSVFEVGTTVVTATATDGPGNQSECTFNVIVQDNQPPTIEVISDPIVLWPPNSKYEIFSIEDFVLAVSDNCEDVNLEDVKISMATSDEPEDANGGGDGHTLNDIVIDEDCQTVKVRKERQGKGNGRVYTIHLLLTDDNGNEAEASCRIHVPRAPGKPAIDDGVAYTVNGDCGNKSAIVSQENHVPSRENDLMAYPNPFSNNTTIVFAVAESGEARVDIYNALGKKIETVFEGYAVAGMEYTSEFKAESLPEGIYYYNLRIGNDVNMMKKLILIR